MYIIYHDKSGAYGSIIAALIHLQQLPIDSIPSTDQLTKLFCKAIKKNNQGILVYQGKDEYDNKIYTLLKKGDRSLAINAIQSVPKMIEKENIKILCVDTSQFNNCGVSLGGFFSMKLSFFTFGNYMASKGIVKAYPKLIELIKKTKLKVSTN